MRERERRESLKALRRQPPLTPEEEPFYLPELAHAVRLIEAAAKQFDTGDRHDQWTASDLRGLARALDSKAAGIAHSRAYFEVKPSLWRRLAQRFAAFRAKPS
jgi:hypothetical protein